MSLPAKLEINITAYEREDMANSCAEQLRFYLPTAFIRVWDNSPTRLRVNFADEVRWNRFNPSLSRVWNWALAQSDTEWVMITNDDIRFQKEWLRDLERDFDERPDAIWHGPSRCFLVHRAIITAVGWFDERMLGFTWEDFDYICRMNAAGVSHLYGALSSLQRNAVSLKGDITRPCHPCNNCEIIKEKYGDNVSAEQFNYIPKLATPDFYPRRPR